MAAKKLTGVGSIEGVGAKTEEKLISGGYDSLEKVTAAKPAEMRKRCDLTAEEAKDIIRNAKAMFDPRTVAKLQRQATRYHAEIVRLMEECRALEYACSVKDRTIADLTEKLKKKRESSKTAYAPSDDCPRDLYR